MLPWRERAQHVFNLLLVSRDSTRGVLLWHKTVGKLALQVSCSQTKVLLTHKDHGGLVYIQVFYWEMRYRDNSCPS